jgi:uncharacterized RDD family membrane protein YckC
LVRVRRRDLRRLQQYGPPPDAVLPPTFAAKGDPRFPSSRLLRSCLAFVIDFALHFGAAAGTLWAFHHLSALTSFHLVLLPVLGAWILASVLNRIFVQRGMQATVGKAALGLRVIRDDTGMRPGLGLLARKWFQSLGAAIELIGTS